MITVTILINGRPILTRSAINREQMPDGRYRYESDDGFELFHHRDDGAVPLAIAMLKTIKEPK